MKHFFLISLSGLTIALLAILIFFAKPFFSKLNTPEKKVKSIAMVTDIGGLGDKAFNDTGWSGVQMASKDLGLKAEVIQTKKDESLADNVSKAADTADIVVGMGYMIKDAIVKAAPSHPDSYFILIDEDAGSQPNVASYKFYSGQSGYLAGIISASVSQKGKIGILKGMDIPPVLTYVAGFEAGIKTWNEFSGSNVQTVAKSADTFTDVEKGKALTKSMIDEGADIVFDAAGATGLGVYEGIQEANRREGITAEDIKSGAKKAKYFGVATDIDHDELYQGEVLVTALKKMSETIYGAAEDITKGKFKGGLHLVDFKDGYTGISEMKYTKQYVPEAALMLVDKAKKIMANRDERLLIPLDMANVDEYVKNFKVPEELLQK